MWHAPQKLALTHANCQAGRLGPQCARACLHDDTLTMLATRARLTPGAYTAACLAHRAPSPGRGLLACAPQPDDFVLLPQPAPALASSSLFYRMACTRRSIERVCASCTPAHVCSQTLHRHPHAWSPVLPLVHVASPSHCKASHRIVDPKQEYVTPPAMPGMCVTCVLGACLLHRTARACTSPFHTDLIATCQWAPRP